MTYGSGCYAHRVRFLGMSCVGALAALAASSVFACAAGNIEDDPDAAPAAEDPTHGAQHDSGHTPFSEADGGSPAKPDDPQPTDSGTTDDGGHSGTDAGNIPASCALPNTCPSATDIGTVSGDTGAATVMGDGITAKWLSVRVTEDNNSILGSKLGLEATLVSPAGVNFDVFLYVNGGSDTQECTTVTGSSSNHTTGTDTAVVSWGESSVANGKVDDRTVSVEVRYVSGTCTPTSKWTLTLKGNP